MSFVVKNTTSFSVWDLICPHFCMRCGQIGSLLCFCCKKYMKNQQNRLILRSDLLCVGERKGALKELIWAYKYRPIRAAGKVLAELLAEELPEMNVVIVPLPTISKHVRERGFDHTLLLAKKLAKMRGWPIKRLLVRENQSVQVGASANQRREQVKNAYRVKGAVDSSKEYLLLDDVWTTGASMLAAKRVLEKAGAKKVKMAVIAISELKQEAVGVKRS